MNRRQLLRTCLAGGAGLLAGRPALASARRPNIVIILTDDMGYADVSFQGATDIPTPHLDRLARTGVRFTSGYVSHPFCSPSRAGLLTGRYQHRFGHEYNPRYEPSDEVAGLPTGETTVADVLKAAGYATGLVGKWHMGGAPKFHPLRRGFTQFFGFVGGGHDYFRADPEGSRRELYIPIERDGKPGKEPEYLTDAFSREAEAFIRRHRADPFFLYLAYNAPHEPQQAPEKYLDRFAGIEDKKRRYAAAMMAAVDAGVGRILSTLEELALDRQTLVIFLSDNGGSIGVNGSRNDPLRGGKSTIYEGGIRVPFVMRWTGHIPAGKECREPVISLDIFATAAALGGARAPANLDGVNVLPWARGKAKGSPHRRLFWRMFGAAWAVREGRYKLLKTGDRAPELYDLENDIGEANDLAASRPEIVARLLAAHEEWNSQMIAPIFRPAMSYLKKK
jgi:arylsulfatase A-like enzyme